jgi:hypothetical protein
LACAALAIHTAGPGADASTGGAVGGDDEDEPMYALRTLQERLMSVRSSFAEAKQLAAGAMTAVAARTREPDAARMIST